VRLHASLQHENVVHLHAAFQEGDKVVMVLVSGGCGLRAAAASGCGCSARLWQAAPLASDLHVRG
jgi:hypothetical protein